MYYTCTTGTQCITVDKPYECLRTSFFESKIPSKFLIQKIHENQYDDRTR